MRQPSILRRLKRLPLLWWLAVGVVAFGVGVTVTNSVASAKAAVQKYEGVVQTAIATRNIAAGSVVMPADVRFEDRPSAFLPESATVTNPVGAVATVAMTEGEVYVASKLGSGGLSPTAAMLQPGERAVAVQNTEASIALRPGDVVDVIGSFSASSAEQSALVLAPAARVIGANERAITVAIGAVEAPAIAAAAAQSQVTLVLTTP